MYSTVLSSNNSDVMILSSFSKDRLHLSSLLLSLSLGLSAFCSCDASRYCIYDTAMPTM
jgi:hypothetical protein